MPMENGEVIAAISAVIALIALFSTLYSNAVQRKHNVLSLKPILDINCTAYPSQPLRFDVKNSGVGPAIIRHIYVVIDGVRYESRSVEDYARIMKQLGPEIGGSEFRCYVTHGNGALRPGESIELLAFTESNQNAKMQALFASAVPRIGIEIDYECVYERRHSVKYKWHRDAG